MTKGDLKEELLRQIQYAEKQFLIAQQYASYWQAMATTGAAARRDIRRGGYDGTQFTDQEKVDEALKNALTHIHRMSEINDFISDNRQKLAEL